MKDSMTDQLYYAHSGIVDKVLSQPYSSHIQNVCNLISNDSARYSIHEMCKGAAYIAGLFHDVGKLSPYIQPTLSLSKQTNDLLDNEEKLLNHVDLGVSFCFKYFQLTKNKIFLYAAVYCYSHHIGLFDLKEFATLNCHGFFGKNNCIYNFERLRDTRIISEKYNIPLNIRVCDYYDYIRDEYIEIAKKLNPKEFLKMDELIEKINHNIDIDSISSTDFRMGMSIFIDADHGDTDVYYSGINTYLQPRINNSLNIVKDYQADKQLRSNNTLRNNLRSQLFNKSIDINSHEMNIVIDAPVGSGKTLSIIGLGEKTAEFGTQKVIYLSPFNNINEQTYSIYTEIFRPSNNYYCVKAYCTSTFENPILRRFSYKFQSPITITSGVNFIETILSHRTSDIRMFKYLTNTTIVLDEYHTLMPHKLFSVFIDIMKDLNKFNTRIVFSSGTPCDIWNIFNKDIKVHDVIDSILYRKMLDLEHERISYHNLTQEINTVNLLTTQILKDIGKKSILVVTNTRKNAYLISKNLSNKTNYPIYHISNNMSGSHIKKVINQTKNDIRDNKNPILIGTNLIECGYDISFNIGYKELSSFSSIIQFGGRINRHCEGVGQVNVYSLERDDDVSNNPMLENSIEICKKYIDRISPEIVPSVISEEVSIIYNKANSISKAYHDKSYLYVSNEKKIIAGNTIRVILDPTGSICDSIKESGIISNQCLQESISLFFSKKDELIQTNKIKEIKIGQQDSSLLFWISSYDPIYGLSPQMY